MSLRSGQHDGGFVRADALKEPMSLSEVLHGTTFVSANGRVYHLFGNEEDTFAIPPIPSALVAPKMTIPSLEEALQQIESFSSQTVNDKSKPVPLIQSVQTAEPIGPPEDLATLSLLPLRSDSAGLRLVPGKSPKQNMSIPAKELVHEASQQLPESGTQLPPKPRAERPRPLRILSDPVEEPFIIPFAKPEPPPKEPETKPVMLKIVTETIPRIDFPKKIMRKYRHRHRCGTTFYRKRLALPPASPSPIAEPLAVEPLTFRWSEQLNSLMQTAENQIRTLADHLIVQSNQGTKAVCFKSVFPGDGCSTVLLCAVRALIERQYRILLVDAHHQHIDLPKQLNLPENLTAGNNVIPLSDDLGLWVWQGSKTPVDNRIALAKTLTEHRDKYDLILVDNGSVTESPLTELLEFWNQIELDGIILVTNTKHPSEMPLSHIAGRFRQHHLHLIGITENYV